MCVCVCTQVSIVFDIFWLTFLQSNTLYSFTRSFALNHGIDVFFFFSHTHTFWYRLCIFIRKNGMTMINKKNNNSHRKHSSNHADTLLLLRGEMLALIGIAHSYTVSCALALWRCECMRFFPKQWKLFIILTFLLHSAHWLHVSYIWFSITHLHQLGLMVDMLFVLLFFVIYIDFSTFVRLDVRGGVCECCVFDFLDLYQLILNGSIWI